MITKGINGWSFSPELSVVDQIRSARRHGYAALELCVGGPDDLPFETAEREAQSWRRTADAEGIALASVASSLYWERAVTSADDLRRLVAVAAGLEARTLLVIPGALDHWAAPRDEPGAYDAVKRGAKEAIAGALPDAQAAGVRLGVENVWNKFLLSPAEMRAFVDEFGSTYVGAYVDVGNVMAYGFPDDWLRTLGSRVVGVHLKDFRRAVGTVHGFVDLLEGDVPWPFVADALRTIGYDGPAVAEMVPRYRHHPEVRLANASRAMDAIFGREAA